MWESATSKGFSCSGFQGEQQLDNVSWVSRNNICLNFQLFSAQGIAVASEARQETSRLQNQLNPQQEETALGALEVGLWGPPSHSRHGRPAGSYFIIIIIIITAVY